MKPSAKAFITALGLTAVASGIFLWRKYKKNKKSLEQSEKDFVEDFKDLGIDNVKEVMEETVKTDSGSANLNELPRSSQLLRLLQNSSHWNPTLLDAEDAIYGDVDSGDNSVHVLFKDNRVGIFVEAPVIPRYSKLRYFNYTNSLCKNLEDFWKSSGLAAPEHGYGYRGVRILGYYSKVTEETHQETGGTLKVLEFSEIPESTLISKSTVGNRQDGLNRYFSQARRDSSELPEDVYDIHMFIGFWLKLGESYDEGLNMADVIDILERLVVDNPNPVQNDYGGEHQSLGPVIVHPEDDFGVYLNDKLFRLPIEVDDGD